MINRRHALWLVLAALPAAWLPSAVHAQPAFQRFLPFLVDLSGWKGEKPDGVSMEMPGNSMISAARRYERGGASLDAQIVMGTAAQGALAATHSGMHIETSDMRMSTSTIDGLPVTRTYTISSKSGAVMVALSANALFSLSFNGIADDEALTLARKFDWRAMQAAQPK